MLRRLFRDSAIYAGAGLFSQAVAFALFPFLAHSLRPADYGVIDVVGLLTSVAMLTIALEINEGLGRVVASTEDAEERIVYASTGLIWSIASYSLFAVLGLLAAKPLTHLLLGSHVNLWVTRIAISGIWVAGVLYVVQDQLRWQLRPHSFVVISVVVASITTGATALYVFGLGLGVVGVIAGQLSGVSAGLGVGLVLSRGMFTNRFEWVKARSMLEYSIPLVPGSVGVFLNGYADRLAIQHEQSLAGVGLYGVGFRLATLVTLLLLGVQNAVTPQVLARHADPLTPPSLAAIFRMCWAAGCVIFLCLSVLAEPLIAVLSARTFFAAARVVPYLVAATFLAGLYVFAPGPKISGRTKLYASVNVTAGLMNLVLAFALVPVLGIRGAGAATVASSAFVFGGTMWLSQRLYPVPHNWTRLFLGAATAVATVVATRSLLVTSRAETLGLESILGRLAICAVGSVLIVAVLVDWKVYTGLNQQGLAARARGLVRNSAQR